jgi:hypothetical protein
MFEYINGWEWFPVGFLAFIGFMMILFVEEEGMTWLGILVLGMIMFIGYNVSANNQAKEFVLKRFNEGQAIECGLWRGEGTLIDRHNGWKHVSALGFVKGDRIHNDLGLCHVVAKEAPNPSEVPYWMAFLTMILISFLFRHAIWGIEKEDQAMEKPHE